MDNLEERIKLEQHIWDRAASAVASGIRWGDINKALSSPALVYLRDFVTEDGLENKRVLELGGSGRRAVPFLLSGARRTCAIDVSFETLRLGRSGARDWQCAEHVLFSQAAAERLPFADESFDIVYGDAILHHVLLDEAAAEVLRVLKPGGRGAFHEPLGESFHLRFARKHLPYWGKLKHGTDRPLFYGDLDQFVGHFSWGEYQEFEFIEQLAKLLPSALNRAWRRAMRPIDKFMLKRASFLGRFCRTISIRVKKSERPSGASKR